MKKMFKLLTLVLSVMMIATCAVNAGQYDDVFANLSFSEFALYEQGTLDAVQLRAFAVDPNGKYYYGGLLNGGTPTVYQFDAATGDPVCTYQFDPSEDPGAYIKALAADDRGYVYMGVANAANNGAVYFAICSEDGLEEIKWVKIEIEGKVGVNGACVREVNGNYYLYFITNYDSDRLYCYDVTDVNNPTVFNAFGSDGFSSGGGYLDLTSGFGMQDANNIAIDEMGYIYICATTGVGSKGDTIFKVSADGTGIVGQASVSECFGVAILGNGYLATCTYEGADSKVHILNQQDLSPVTVIGYDNANNFTQLGMIGNRLYMADQGPDAVLVSSEINFPVVVEPDPEVPAEDAGTDTAPEAPVTADAGLAAASILLAAAAAVALKARKH